jgi:hypothetical protein
MAKHEIVLRESHKHHKLVISRLAQSSSLALSSVLALQALLI